MAQVEHINGNALYSTDERFVSALRREFVRRPDSGDTWAFDVLIGHWLLRAHPSRIGVSPHVLSISTFQRNRTCCELVWGRTTPGAPPHRVHLPLGALLTPCTMCEP